MKNKKEQRLETLNQLFTAFEAGLCGLNDPSSTVITSQLYSQGTVYRSTLIDTSPSTRVFHR